MMTHVRALVNIITMSQPGAPPSWAGAVASAERLGFGGGAGFAGPLAGAGDTPHTGGLRRMFSARGIM